MPKRNRGTLKHYFEKGSLPTQDQFQDLVDSMLNMVDEGFDKSPENGLEISSLGNYDGLINFCRNNDSNHPLWSIRYDPSKAKLLIVNREKKSVLTLDPDGRVGVNTQDPQWQLDVEGVVSSKGRIGAYEEGYVPAKENGLEISSLGNYDGLINFCRNNDSNHPLWSIRYDPSKAKLLIVNREKKSVLTLDPDGRVGVNTQDPQWQLDVEGVVSSKGRIGAYEEGYVPANGKWHRITKELSGCQAFEVMAGAGKKKTGRYALMHAFAMNTFNPKGWFFNLFNLKKRIRYHQAYYRSFGNKLKLRWVGENRKYYLEIRSNGDYGEGIRIRYHMTNLWFDEDMSESWLSSENGK